jgi:hypothetical protein
VSAVFAFGVRPEREIRGRDWVGLSLARRVALRWGLADPGVLASEGCLTISSEERETWTAASLRGSFVLKGMGGSEEIS